MAKRVFQVTGYTFTATSASATLASGSYMGINAGSSTQRLDVLEVYWGGMATTSAVTLLQLSRTAVAGTSTSALVSHQASDGPLDSATSALTSPAWVWTAAGTNAAASAALTDAKLNLAGNTFGGIVRWNAAPTQQWTVSGVASPSSSVLFANNSGSAANAVVSAHIIYEMY